MVAFLCNPFVAFIVIIIGGYLVNLGDPPAAWLGAGLVYTVLLLPVVIAFLSSRYNKRLLWSSLISKRLPFTALISLFFVPGVYVSYDRDFRTMDMIELRSDRYNYAVTASNLCPDYFAGGVWDKWVRLRNRAWCEAFPEYDATAKVTAVNTDATASTMETEASSSSLWK